MTENSATEAPKSLGPDTQDICVIKDPFIWTFWQFSVANFGTKKLVLCCGKVPFQKRAT